MAGEQSYGNSKFKIFGHAVEDEISHGAPYDWTPDVVHEVFGSRDKVRVHWFASSLFWTPARGELSPKPGYRMRVAFVVRDDERYTVIFEAMPDVSAKNRVVAVPLDKGSVRWANLGEKLTNFVACTLPEKPEEHWHRETPKPHKEHYVFAPMSLFSSWCSVNVGSARTISLLPNGKWFRKVRERFWRRGRRPPEEWPQVDIVARWVEVEPGVKRPALLIQAIKENNEPEDEDDVYMFCHQTADPNEVWSWYAAKQNPDHPLFRQSTERDGSIPKTPDRLVDELRARCESTRTGRPFVELKAPNPTQRLWVASKLPPKPTPHRTMQFATLDSNPVKLLINQWNALTEQPDTVERPTLKRPYTFGMKWSCDPKDKPKPKPKPYNLAELRVTPLGERSVQLWSEGVPNANTLRDARIVVTESASAVELTGEAASRRHVAEVAATGGTVIESLLALRRDSNNERLNAQPLKVKLEFDFGGLAWGQIETTTTYDHGVAYLVSAAPFAVLSAKGDATPGGKVLAQWPHPDHREGWLFYAPTGEVNITTQAASIAEPILDITADIDTMDGKINDREIKARLSQPTMFTVDQTDAEGDGYTEHYANLTRVLGAQGPRAYGPRLKKASIEPMAGLTFNALEQPHLKLSEIAGVSGDLVLATDPDEAWAPEAQRQHREAVHRTAVFQPWTDEPGTIVTLSRVNVTADLAPRLWADFTHAVPACFRDLLKAPNPTGVIENLLFSALGATGRFSASFGGRIKVAVTLETGRILRYRVEIPGHLSCLGNHASYIAVYERLLESGSFGVAPVLLTEQYIEVTQRNRPQRAGGFHTFIANARYDIVSPFSPTIESTFWVVELAPPKEKKGEEQKELRGAAMCVVPSEASNARDPKGQRDVEDALVTVGCTLDRLSFKASFDPAAPASPDEWPPLEGRDIGQRTVSPSEVISPPTLTFDPAPGLSFDLGRAHSVLVPVPLGGLVLSPIRGSLINPQSSANAQATITKLVTDLNNDWRKHVNDLSFAKSKPWDVLYDAIRNPLFPISSLLPKELHALLYSPQLAKVEDLAKAVASKLEGINPFTLLDDAIAEATNIGAQALAKRLRRYLDRIVEPLFDWLRATSDLPPKAAKLRDALKPIRAQNIREAIEREDLANGLKSKLLAAVSAPEELYLLLAKHSNQIGTKLEELKNTLEKHLKERVALIAAAMETERSIDLWNVVGGPLRAALVLPWTLAGEELVNAPDINQFKTALQRYLISSPHPEPMLSDWMARLNRDERWENIHKEVKTLCKDANEKLLEEFKRGLDALTPRIGLGKALEGLGIEWTTPDAMSALVFETIHRGCATIGSIGSSTKSLVEVLNEKVKDKISKVEEGVGVVLGEHGALTRIEQAIVQEPPTFLALTDALTGARPIALADINTTTWRNAELNNWFAGKVDGRVLARQAGAQFQNASAIGGTLELVRLEAGKLLGTLHNAFAALPFKTPLPLLDLALTPTFDPGTKQVSLSGSGKTNTQETIILIPDLLTLDKGIASYEATGVASEGSGLKLRLRAGLTGDLKVLGDTIEVKDFSIHADERGSIELGLDPAKIKLPGLLGKLNEALAKATGNTCSIEQTSSGVRCRFEHSLPSLGSPGAQMMNLSLGASLALERTTADLQFTLSANVSSRRSPFAVVYSGLGGVGWFRFEIAVSKLLTPNPSTELTLDLGLGVGAAAALELGIVKGAAMISLSLDALIKISPDKPQVALGAQLLIKGELEILELIRVMLSVILRAELRGGELVASGELELEIKLFFFTVHVKERVEWTQQDSGASVPKAQAALESVRAPLAEASLEKRYLRSLVWD